MKPSHMLLLCTLAAALVASVLCQGQPDNCCFDYYPTKLHPNRIRSYYRTDNRCAKSGVILVTKRFAHFCVDPYVLWVKKIMRVVDDRSL